MDDILILALDGSVSPGPLLYWYNFDRRDVCPGEMRSSEESDPERDDSIRSFVTYRILATLPFGFDHHNTPGEGDMDVIDDV